MFPIKFFPEKSNIGFMNIRKLGFAFSIILIIATAYLFFSKGLQLGIDFTGGILMDIKTEEVIDLSILRKELDKSEFGEVSLQYFGDEKEILIRIQATNSDEQAKIIASVKQKLSSVLSGKIDFRKIDYVGPTVGKELVQSGYMSLIIAFVVILLYIWFRFEWQFGVGAIIALLHDVILTVGFFMVSGFDFGLTSVAAILTVVGYSINDSVVIYDRIRENMRRFKKKPLIEIINLSVNETLSRTIITAGTTVLAAGSLVLFGGEVIKGFSAALLFGVVAGTYSSIYIAAPILIYFDAGLASDDDEKPAVIESV